MSGNAVEKLLAKKGEKKGRAVPEARNPKPPMNLPGTGGAAAEVQAVNVPAGPGIYGALPAKKVAPNPRNPRRIFRGLDELALSIRTDGQLQPITVVTVAAYLKLFPEDEALVAGCDWVSCMGARRLNAILQAPDLTVVNAVIDDNLAESRVRFQKAAIEENQKRSDLTVMEEGRAYVEIAQSVGHGGQQLVVEMFGLGKSYVSQRIGLTKLIDDLQDLLDRPDQKDLMPLAVAVKLSKLDPAEQAQIAKPILALEEEEQFSAWKDWERARRTPAPRPEPETAPEVESKVHTVNNGVIPEQSAPQSRPEHDAGEEQADPVDLVEKQTEPEASASALDPIDSGLADPDPTAPEPEESPLHAPPRREPTVDDEHDDVEGDAPEAVSDEFKAAKAAAQVLGKVKPETAFEALTSECDPGTLAKLTEMLYDRL